MSSDNTPKTNFSSPNSYKIFQNLEKKDYHPLIDSLCSLIEKIFVKNKNKKSHKNIFYLSELPKLNFKEYIILLYKCLNYDISTLLLSYISMNKLIKKLKLELTINNFYKLFASSLLVNSKFYEESVHSLSFFSKISGISKKTLLQLEFEYYRLIHYDLFIDDKLYEEYFEFFNKLNL